ncbi:MAG TPA: exonuclease domain-containing protein [Egicoccus sp.]|nr:exonuclease domain-containing protein [Egicoccus sp.]HSK23338.1 exonuclease domain-containing protein [Egicoccus sp.]
MTDPDDPLQRFARHPPPGRRTDVRALRLLALDLETTGLDPAADQVLAVGFVPVDGLAIRLAGARQYWVRPDGPVGSSATVHGLTDDRLRDAQRLGDVLPEVLEALHGRVLLAHHTAIEVGFLTVACQRRYGATPTFTVVDTLRLQRRVLGNRWQSPEPDELRLDAARQHLGLPRYHAHEALTDALACAELYLAQVAHLGGDDKLSLGRIRSRTR